MEENIVVKTPMVGRSVNRLSLVTFTRRSKGLIGWGRIDKKATPHTRRKVSQRCLFTPGADRRRSDRSLVRHICQPSAGVVASVPPFISASVVLPLPPSGLFP